MWTLQNSTPFPAETGFFRGSGDRSLWGLWIKTSFALRDGQLPLFVADQAPLNPGAVSGDGDRIIADADMVPGKDRIDLVIRATATQPVAEADPRPVRLDLGDW